MAGDAPPDLAVVLSMTDPVERNRAITRTYRRLAAATAGVLGGPDANWLTFGAWASATAGRFIRGEGISLGWGSAAVAEGNRAIIGDIGPRFARFVTLAGTPGAGPLRGRVGRDPLLTGTDELAEAFDCYARVVDDPALDDRERAQLVLLANVLVAAHEQRLADPHVDAALPLGGPAGIIATRFVRMRIPDGDIDVCEDVPLPAYLHGQRWPAPLDHLEDPRLRALFAELGQGDDARGSAVGSWEDLHDRMGFIATFFRAYQRDPSLAVVPDDVCDGRA